MVTVVPQRHVMSLQAAPPRVSSLKAEARFGQYVLGQTLGEGEFGKVKLGWTSKRNGTNDVAQVAIKLIRRESVGNSRSRMNKIEREISVLRRVSHPNIVKCYEVVETEKYIGIILEYASGGELFDFILAHRYLKDQVASRLFAQLVSAVQYLHSKGIVHRDLKLENLLLDRNRNLIITDFGFANTFDAQQSSDDAELMKRHEVASGGQVRGDLMQTSCGSPCYAAPELVVSDGHYCGRKVDVWSCGVILYAMLAGYLPFDDDPSNPEGDNISLLYKYIIGTSLTFPEYVSPLARDLLRRILVPDPQERAFLTEVIAHKWLASHANVMRINRTPPSSSSASAGAQDMMRSSSERTASHNVQALPASNHLVPTGFSKNTSMGPPSDLPVTSKRHTLQIEYERPSTSTTRLPRKDVATQSRSVEQSHTVVEGLSIAASPHMARSASHSGTDHGAASVSPKAQAKQALISSTPINLPVPEVRVRPSSYAPMATRPVEPVTHRYIVDSHEEKRRLGSRDSATSSTSRNSWSRGSLAQSKTASPRSTKQNVAGEMTKIKSPASSAKVAQAHSLSLKPVVSHGEAPRSRHKRNSSSISGMLSKLWPGQTHYDVKQTDPLQYGGPSQPMESIEESGHANPKAPRPLSLTGDSTNDESVKCSPDHLATGLQASMPFAKSTESATIRRSRLSVETSPRPSESNRQASGQNRNKPTTSASKGAGRASSSAAKRVMDFFSGRRKDRSQNVV